MFSFFIYGGTPSIACMASAKGEVDMCEDAKSPADLETAFRNSVIKFGCMAGVCIHVTDGRTIRKAGILDTVSQVG